MAKKRRTKKRSVTHPSSLPGRPGYRSRPGSSGLDPMDTYQESAFMEGRFVRQLLTGRLRTRNPVYLAFMLVCGIGLLLPLCAILVGSANVEDGSSILCIGPLGLMGAALVINVVLSIRIIKRRRPRRAEKRRKKLK